MEEELAGATETLRGTLGALPFVDDPGLASGSRCRHYELIREIGRGGMSHVWAARDTKLGRRVAMKFVFTGRRDGVERFLVEARATAQCHHENIVVIHEVGEHEGQPYLVLEHLEGQTLRALLGELGRGTPLPAARAVELAQPIARALAHAHDLGIVHRDLKPENVFVTSSGHVKVLDFGIATAIGAVETGIVGTLPYMAPEQLRGTDVDARADLWALGVLLFEMISGRHPLAPCTREGLEEMARGRRPLARLRDASGAPPALCELVDGLLEIERERRPASARDVTSRLAHDGPRRFAIPEDASPYPGLAAFRDRDAHRFFGRDREIARVIARVRETPLLGVLGASGVGKSSFLRAGLGPALEASDPAWRVLALRPGRQPLAALASAIGSLDEAPAVGALRDQPGLAGAVLRGVATSTRRQILVLVDQFEELYTLASDPDEARAFTDAICGIADDPSSPLRVVLAMRSDFLDRTAEDARFMDELGRGLVFLASPDREGLRAALVDPLALHGYRFESPDIADELVATLSTTDGALSLLQFAAVRLWEERDRADRVIRTESYRAIGGLTGALAEHADRVLEIMPPAMQAAAKDILRMLVTPERTRSVVELAELQERSREPAVVVRVIERLVAARLLVVQQAREGGTTVELVHDSLIERWPMLRRLLEEERGEATFRALLAGAAKQWDASGRAVGLLWTGDAVPEARRWFARGRELAPRDHAFLEAVLALDRRRRRARRATAITVFALLALVAAGALIAAIWIRGAQQDAAAQARAAETALGAAQQRERERDAAELRRTEAEQRRASAETQQREAERRSVLATAGKRAADLTIEQQNAELRAKTRHLEEALASAGTAAEQARAATSAAERANAELRRENDRKAAEIQRLMNEALSRTLK